MVNLFWLSKPQIIKQAGKAQFNYDNCAIEHHDAHVVKIALECAQLLYNSHHTNPISENWKDQAPMTKSGNRGFKMFNKNNPISVWIRSNLYHYRHAADYGLALCKEYTYRYGKVHSCEPHIKWLKENEPPLPDDLNTITSPPLAMPNTYRPEHLRIPEEVKKTKSKRKATDPPQAISKRRKKIPSTSSVALTGTSTVKSEDDDKSYLFTDETYKAYKDYYLGEKITLKRAIWTKREIPEWITTYAKESKIKIPALSKTKEPETKKSKKKKE